MLATIPRLTLLPYSRFDGQTPGLYTDLPMDAYQAADGLSKSRLTGILRSPLDFYRKKIGGLKTDPTEALEHGTIYHDGTFENVENYYIKPETYRAPESAKKDAPLIDKPWNGNANACKEWLEKHSDKPVLSAFDAKEIQYNIRYIRDHHKVARILSRPGFAEVSMFARHPVYGFTIKGRADWLWMEPDGTVCAADLKTCLDATTDAFSREIVKRFYHVQAAQYREILRALGYHKFKWVFIAFEKGQAPKCNVRPLKESAMDRGAEILASAYKLYSECDEAAQWPEFPDADDGEPFDIPEHAYGKLEDLEGMTEAGEVGEPVNE